MVNFGNNRIGIDSGGNGVGSVIIALTVLSGNGAPVTGNSALTPGGTGLLINLETGLIDGAWTTILSLND